jgi:hypothetical protein
MAPFMESSSGFQYLSREGGVAVIISVDGRW